MRKLLIALLFSMPHAVCIGACPEQIRQFYTDYLTNILQDDSRNAALCEALFTEELREKLRRVGRATGADPVIRAQDANEDALETLRVEELGGNWYLVSYFWKKGDDGTLTEIPLKARAVDGRCRITYITPVWNGSRYGDELFVDRSEAGGAIDGTSSLSFVKSFYEAYTAAYCGMPKDLSARLGSFRSKYLSPNALEQYGRAETENSKDGLEGYDLLIDHFDFDCLWRKSLTVTPLKDGKHRISYRDGSRLHRIVVTVGRREGTYRIDAIALAD